MKPIHGMVLLAFAWLPAACSTTPLPTKAPAHAPVPDSDAETRARLQEFGAQYQYDVGYMETLLDLSPGAYAAFAGGMGMSGYRVHLPLDAYYTGLISALLADDCGACTQLNLRMAAEAGVDRAILRQLLEDPSGLPADLRLVHRYATQVVKGENASAESVKRLKKTFGEEAFAELAVNVLGARIYPALRRAMGAETTCPPPSLDF